MRVEVVLGQILFYFYVFYDIGGNGIMAIKKTFCGGVAAPTSLHYTMEPGIIGSRSNSYMMMMIMMISQVKPSDPH